MTQHFDGETGEPIPAPDLINSPVHYQGAKWESIDVIEALGNQFRLGNALKYIFRHEKKGGREDLLKARWYLERELVQSRPTRSETFNHAFWYDNAMHLADNFGIKPIPLINVVACISAACMYASKGGERDWRENVHEALGHLNEHILGLEQMGGVRFTPNCTARVGKSANKL